MSRRLAREGVVWMSGDRVVLRESLLFGADNNIPKWRYVPADVSRYYRQDTDGRIDKTGVEYLRYYRGGSGERPINFSTLKHAVAFHGRSR